jgi:2-polyprenyl-3-methyl-5-hydroxy-6-metoxy-1,4-benzoquinol methylase
MNKDQRNFEYKKNIGELYKKILKREPDKTGLDYFLSKLKNKTLTISEISIILSESNEGLAIRHFSHYSDKYWNDLPAVQKYKNNLSSEDNNLHWIEDIKNRFQSFLPFENVLIVGCGNGWLERQLFDMGIGKNFDAFDISEKYIKEAKEKKEQRPIRYFNNNINDLQNLSPKKYDAIFNFAILHHATEIDNAMKKLSITLKSEGLIFNEEYVGPARNQYSEFHLQKMLEIMKHLPEKFHSKHILRPPLVNFRVEPSEAIHSDMVIPTFKKYFNTVYEKNLNGGIAYQILWNNIKEFQNSQDLEAKKWLDYLLIKDYEMTEKCEVPVLFWYGVGKPKL